MSSASRLSYFGPEDFPSLRAFLQRSGYSLEGCENQRLAWKLPNTFVKFSATEAMILCRCWICFWQSAPNGYHNPIKENWKPGRMRVAIRPRKSLQNPWSCDGLLESGSD